MLTADFGVLDTNGKLVSQKEIFSLFDIYCLDAAKDCYLLDSREGRIGAGCPLLYVCDGKVEFVFPEDGQWKELKARIEAVALITADRLPSDVKSLLFDKISSHFVFTEQGEQQ